MAWTQEEHLTLAAVVFPILVRRLSEDARVYALTDDDLAAIDALEPFADQAFLAPPPEWRRLCS